MQAALRFLIVGTKLEIWQGDRLIRTTTVNCLLDLSEAVQRGRKDVTL